MNQLQAKNTVCYIYRNLRIDKKLKIKSRFNNLLLYFSLLESCRESIPNKEYKKLKNILNKELNSLFFKNRKSKNKHRKYYISKV